MPGPTRCWCSSFGAELASTTAEDFVAKLLAERIGAAGVVTGDDFTFGKGRGGNVEVLKELGARVGIAAETVAPVLLDGERISSGRIREALAAGDPGTATHLLSRPFAVEAVVERGDGRGRELGWPTANVGLGDYQRPAYGIYAVRVRLDDGSEYPGVASFGVRPMLRAAESNCSKRICSTSTATFTAGRSRSRSISTSGRSGSSTICRSSPRRCRPMRRRPASCWHCRPVTRSLCRVT